MPRLRRLQKWTAAVLGLAALGLAGWAGWVVVTEWTYLDRMAHYPAGEALDVAWFTPKARVPGVPSPRNPFGPAAGDDATRFAEVARVAGAKNSAAVFLVHHGRLALERHAHGHRPGGWTNSASMAKSVTSVLVGVAVAEGKIRSIDDPASTWIDAWRADDRRRITLRHLLQMHSGLRPMGDYTEPFSDASYLALGTDLQSVVDGVPAVTEPGRRFDYSNVNFQALGFVLEAATGRRYAEYLSETLWRPLGAGDAALWLDDRDGSARTFGYLFADPADWARVGQLLLNEGEWEGRQVVPREYVRAMRTPSPTEPGYGLGVWLASNDRQRREGENPFDSEDLFWLDGRGKQRVYVFPPQKAVLVRVGENARGWDESALPNALVRALGGAAEGTAP